MGPRGRFLAGVSLALLCLAPRAQASVRHALPELAPGAAARLEGALAVVVRSAKDLGPSHARVTAVALRLRRAADRALVVAWSGRHHLHAIRLVSDVVVLVEGSPAAIGAAFSTRIDAYRAVGGQLFDAPASTPRLPRRLVPLVSSLGSIDTLARLRTDDVPAGGLSPTGVMDAYDAVPLAAEGDRGQGETVVLFELDGYRPADLARYARRFHLAAFHVARIGPDLRPGGEAPMDLEAVHAVAPGARLVYVNVRHFGGGTVAKLSEAFGAVVKRYPGAVWSMSFGVCEWLVSPSDQQDVDAQLAAAERQGTSVFVSSGDTGGLDCEGIGPSIPAEGVQFPASLPHVTAVGGTTLSVATTGAYVGESAWSEPLLSQGTSGGDSVVWRRPAWQRAPGTAQVSFGPSCEARGGCREVPDVSAVADPVTGLASLLGGSWQSAGGTSLAAPVWAGFTALIDEQLHARGARPLGFANPLLYALARDVRPSPFHDVVAGGNDFFTAGPGFDLATGLGSPDVARLAADLAPALGGN